MKQPLNEQFQKMQKIAGIKLNENTESRSITDLIQMYVDNVFDEGMSAEAAINKIDELLQGKLDDYDKAFLAGNEDNY
jgi:hypothetical protein